jgi:hypothetical protein
MITMAVKLPMTKEQFNTGEQAKFKQSIASAASVSADDVTIDKIENMRRSGRRLLAGSIRVDTSIVAADQTAAKSMANTLTVDKINAELGKNSLPQAEILDPPKVIQIERKPGESTTPPPRTEESNKTQIVIAAVVSSIVILFAVGACVFIRRRRTATKKADTHVWTDVAGASTSRWPQAARTSASELDHVMMDLAPTPGRPTMTTVTTVQLPEMNPIDFSKPPEEFKSEIAKRIKELLSKSNVTLSAESGFIHNRPMEGVAELIVAPKDHPAPTSKVIPAGVDPSRETSTSTQKTPAPQATNSLAPVACMAQASLGSDPANKISSRDRLKAMFPRADDDSEDDEKDSDVVHGLQEEEEEEAMFPRVDDSEDDEKDSVAVHGLEEEEEEKKTMSPRADDDRENDGKDSAAAHGLV